VDVGVKMIVTFRIPRSGLKNLLRFQIILVTSLLTFFCPRQWERAETISNYFDPKKEDFMPPLVEDWKWAVLTIAQEASSEPFEGKVAVAEVIRNRMKQKFFSDGTIFDTVLKPYQFSGWNTSDPNRARVARMDLTNPSIIECIQAYEEAFLRNSDIIGDANLYHSIRMFTYPDWTKHPKVKKLKTVGSHVFYFEDRS
jgi:hypothetical protein